MVRFIVVGRRTWRWTVALAIVLGLGAWAATGEMTRPALTPEQVRSAWEGVLGWVAGILPGSGAPAERVTVSSSPPAAPAAGGTTGTASGPAAAASEAGSEEGAEPAAAVTAGDAPPPAGAEAVLPASLAAPDGAAGAGYDLYRMDRARVRSERMELLRQVLEDTTASEVRRADAQAAMLQELGRLEQELAIENLLRVQGYEGAVAILGSEGVEVILPQVLDAQQASRIGGLVANVAGVGIQQVSLVDGLTAVR